MASTAPQWCQGHTTLTLWEKLWADAPKIHLLGATDSNYYVREMCKLYHSTTSDKTRENGLKLCQDRLRSGILGKGSSPRGRSGTGPGSAGSQHQGWQSSGCRFEPLFLAPRGGILGIFGTPTFSHGHPGPGSVAALGRPLVAARCHRARGRGLPREGAWPFGHEPRPLQRAVRSRRASRRHGRPVRWDRDGRAEVRGHSGPGAPPCLCSPVRAAGGGQGKEGER